MVKRNLPTYSQQTKISPESNSDNVDEFQTLLKEIRELNSICNLAHLISIVREMKEQFKATVSPLDKIMILQKLAEKWFIRPKRKTST